MVRNRLLMSILLLIFETFVENVCVMWRSGDNQNTKVLTEVYFIAYYSFENQRYLMRMANSFLAVFE